MKVYRAAVGIREGKVDQIVHSKTDSGWEHWLEHYAEPFVNDGSPETTWYYIEVEE